jgi:hypothetical protein
MNNRLDVAQIGITGKSDNQKRLVIGLDTSGNGFGFIKVGRFNYAWTNLAIQPNGGNVGIGTVEPHTLLEIKKDVRSGQGPVFELTNGGSYGGASSKNFFPTYNRETSNPSARIKVEDNGDRGGNIYFDTKGTSGDAGIGMTNPQAYKLAVAGSIHATEIKVEALPWADYVFKPTYRLPTLLAVKAYIDRNHHLPEIPSEREVAKEGVNLGDMNRLLLRKLRNLRYISFNKIKS